MRKKRCYFILLRGKETFFNYQVIARVGLLDSMRGGCRLLKVISQSTKKARYNPSGELGEMLKAA